jgi:gamma-glutamyltranspeptidase
VQVILKHTVFGRDIQEAIEVPRFRSFNLPDSLSPHEFKLGTIQLEQPLFDEMVEEMESLGYKIVEKEHWGTKLGGFDAVIREPIAGQLNGGVDPREES